MSAMSVCYLTLSVLLATNWTVESLNCKSRETFVRLVPEFRTESTWQVLGRLVCASSSQTVLATLPLIVPGITLRAKLTQLM